MLGEPEIEVLDRFDRMFIGGRDRPANRLNTQSAGIFETLTGDGLRRQHWLQRETFDLWRQRVVIGRGAGEPVMRHAAEIVA